MRLQAEQENFRKFCKEHESIIKDFHEKVVKNHWYVKSALDYTAYDLARYYCKEVYNENTYSLLYRKYDCNDNHVLTLAKDGLKTIGIK